MWFSGQQPQTCGTAAMLARPIAAAIIIAACAAATSAKAGMIEFFTDRASFEAAAGAALDRESFEAPFTSAATVDFGAFTLGEKGGAENLIVRLGQGEATALGVGNAITHGSFAAFYGDVSASAHGVFDFPVTSPINAFGVDMTFGPNLDPDFDPDQFPNEIIVISFDVFLGGDNRGGFAQFTSVNIPTFLGAIAFDGLFDRVTVGAGPRVVVFDDVAYGTVAVPEPAALALLSLGLCSLTLAAALRRPQVAA
ncbi:MAG: PEP-CTERM sorting domain-containing protein [Rhodospirillales bacterium]|nr:MAG: PEP-CTERM sorting domain-containing protein [Rhodospirillales bacterium]